MAFEELIAPFRSVQEDPCRRVRELKAASSSLKVIGFLFPDVPEELLHAFGALPFALPGTVERVDRAYASLPTFSCPFNVSPLEAALRGELDFLDGLIIPYGCDAMRAFSHVWETHFPDLFNYTLWLPKAADVEGARVFLKQEFLRMKRALANFAVEAVPDDALLESIEIFNRNRGLLRSLHQRQSSPSTALSNTDFMAVVRASALMPKEEHSDRLEALLEALPAGGTEKAATGPKSIRVFLFGSVCDVAEVYRCLDKAGIMAVDDSLYNGTRYYNEDVDEVGDPVENLVARHFRKDPMSCYHYREGRFRESLRRRIVRAAVDGVVYLCPKNCEVLQLDYPMVKTLLGEMDLPSMFVEVDHTLGSSAQLETRLEAFGEMILERKSGGV